MKGLGSEALANKSVSSPPTNPKACPPFSLGDTWGRCVFFGENFAK